MCVCVFVCQHCFNYVCSCHSMSAPLINPPGCWTLLKSHHTEDSECGALLGAFLAFLACKWLKSHGHHDFPSMGTLPAWRVLGLAVELPSHCWNASAHPSMHYQSWVLYTKLVPNWRRQPSYRNSSFKSTSQGIPNPSLKTNTSTMCSFVFYMPCTKTYCSSRQEMFHHIPCDSKSASIQGHFASQSCWMKKPSIMQTACHIIFLNSL